MSIDDDLIRLLTRIAEALERIVHLMETEPIKVKIPNLHPSILRPDLSDEEADRFFKAINEEDTDG